MQIRALTLDDYPIVMPLLLQRWEENGDGQSWGFPLNPDLERYRWMSDADLWHAFGAFEDDELIGYCAGSTAPTSFNATAKIYNNEIIYVKPEHQGGSAGARLVLASEQKARELGALRAVWHAHPGTRWDAALQKHNYNLMHIVYSKELIRG